MFDNNKIVAEFDSEQDDTLKINLDKIQDCQNGCVIYLNGYIDTYNSSSFQKRIGKLVDAGYINLIFNCSALNYVSSTGIGSFTAFLKLVKPKGGDIVLLSIQPKVYEVFQLLGFSQFFLIKDTLEDAVSYLKKEKNEDNSIFPKIFECPVCTKKLKAVKAGRFRCSECKTIISVNNTGDVSLD